MAQHPRRATPVVSYWENSQAEPWRQFKLPNIFLCKYISLCFKGKTLRPGWEHPGRRSAWWWSAQPCVGSCGSVLTLCFLSTLHRYLSLYLSFTTQLSISVILKYPLWTQVSCQIQHCLIALSSLWEQSVGFYQPEHQKSSGTSQVWNPANKKPSQLSFIHSPTIWNLPSANHVSCCSIQCLLLGSHPSLPTSSDRRPCPCFPGWLVGGLVSVVSVLWTHLSLWSS